MVFGECLVVLRGGFDKVLTKYHKSGEDENHRKIKDEVGSLKLLGILPKLIWYLFGM